MIDTRTNRVTSTIPLEGPKRISVLRRGEQTFYTARYSFQGQIGCANCHIDSTFDGLTWDLEPDGFGRDIVDNKLHRRYSKAPSPTSGTAAIRTCPPNADRARKNISGARRTTTTSR